MGIKKLKKKKPNLFLNIICLKIFRENHSLLKCSWGKDREFGINRYKLLHIEWINKGPTVQHRELYSESCDHNGREYEKEHICAEPSYCMAEINTTL